MTVFPIANGGTSASSARTTLGLGSAQKRHGFGTKENDPVLLLHTVRLWEEICSILKNDGPDQLTNEHRDVLRWLVDWGSYVNLLHDDREEIRLRNGLRLELPKYGDLPKSSRQFLNTVFAHWREPHENY